MQISIRRWGALGVALVLVAFGTATLAGAAPVVFSSSPFRGWQTNGKVRAVLTVGTTAYAGGDFTTVRSPDGTQTLARAHLAAWDVRTGQILPGFAADTNGNVESLASDGNRLFVGGDYTSIKGVTKTRLAAVDLTSGNVVTSFTANANSHVYALRAAGGRVFVGGTFSTLAGGSRSRLGAVSATTGALDAFNAGTINDAVHGIVTAPDGATVYFAGDFSTVAGAARQSIAAVSATTGALSPLVFQYPRVDTATPGMDGLDISPGGDRIFGALTGHENRIETWSTRTGQVDWYYQVDGDVQAVRYYNGNAYFGFHEGALDDHTVRLLAADAATGQIENSFRPPIDSFYAVWALDATSQALVVGGEFFNVNGVPSQGVAIMPPASVDASAPTAPGAPGVTGTTGSSVSLTWSPGTDNNAVVAYRVLRNGNEVGYPTTTSFTDTDLPADTDVTYTVQAVDAAGNRSAPSPATVAHTGLVAVATGAVWRYNDTGTDLGTAWRAGGYADAAWASGPAQLGYGDGDEATVVGYGPSATAKYITTYFRRTFTVTDPSQIAALTLRLLRDDGAVVYLNGTEVVRSNLPAGTITSATRASVDVTGADESAWTPYAIDPTRLVAGTNTLAVEIHQASSGSSDISFDLGLEATKTTLAPGPTGLAVTGTMDTTASLAWNAPVTGGTISGYRVYRDGTLVASPAGTTVTDTGLASGRAYSYAVSAVIDGVESARSTAVTATTTTNPPPTNLRVTGATETTVDLAWDAPAGAGTTTGYRVYRGATLVGSPTGTAFGDTGLAAGQSVTYTVSAVTNGTETAPGAPLTTTVPDLTKPNAPTNVTAPTVTATSVTLAWTAPADNVGVTGYDVLRNGSVIGSSTAAGYTDGTVATNQTYSYSVRARDAAGNVSDPSTALPVTTPAFVAKVTEDTFDSGTFATGRWTTAGASLIPGTTPGSFYARTQATASAAGSLSWPTSVIEQNHRSWSLRFYARVGSHATNQSVSLVELKNSASKAAYLWTDASTGRCVASIAGTTATSAGRCEDSAWHLIEMKGDLGSTYTLDWRVDGVAQPSITVTGQTAATVRNLYLGEPSSGHTNVIDWDNVKLAVADASVPFLGGLTPFG